MSILNVSTPLNETQRNALRGLVRSQSGFAQWRESRGYSVHLTKAQIIEAIEHFGVESRAGELLADAAQPDASVGQVGDATEAKVLARAAVEAGAPDASSVSPIDSD